jgi:hypothetical protein
VPIYQNISEIIIVMILHYKFNVMKEAAELEWRQPQKTLALESGNERQGGGG